VAEADEDPLLGKVLLGKLEVIRLLGAGGMGAVYEVVHRITRHHRALKVLHADFAKDAEVVARFLREASVAGTLNSAHVVETFDAGQLEDGSPYVLMEMLEGETLADLLERGAVAPARIAQLLHAACEGLAAAHDAGIVHRDIKPENLFVARDGEGSERLKILDFGISKFARPDDEQSVRLTQTGRVLGTPLYMSPEQASAQSDLDARTDVYSLGVILYEALAGRPPFLAETLPALVIQIHTGDFPPLADLAPHAPPGLRAVVERAMARDREARYADGRALAAALAPFAGEGEGAAVALASTMASMPPPGRGDAETNRGVAFAETAASLPPPSSGGAGLATGPLSPPGAEAPGDAPSSAAAGAPDAERSEAAAPSARGSAAGGASDAPSHAGGDHGPSAAGAPDARSDAGDAPAAAAADAPGSRGGEAGPAASEAGRAGPRAARAPDAGAGAAAAEPAGGATTGELIVPSRSRLPVALGAAAAAVAVLVGGWALFGGDEEPSEPPRPEAPTTEASERPEPPRAAEVPAAAGGREDGAGATGDSSPAEAGAEAEGEAASGGAGSGGAEASSGGASSGGAASGEAASGEGRAAGGAPANDRAAAEPAAGGETAVAATEGDAAGASGRPRAGRGSTGRATTGAAGRAAGRTRSGRRSNGAASSGSASSPEGRTGSAGRRGATSAPSGGRSGAPRLDRDNPFE
jgi:serine/threonine-protein kinase